MEEFVNKGKEILKILIGNGFEAYFVGEFVRNRVMQLPINNIEINTSATPEAIKGIFDFTKVEDYKEGVVKVAYYGRDFLISTFKTEEFKDKRNPVKIHYSKNLLDDLSSREFTINAMVMSHSNKLTDAYDGIGDINKKKIRLIGKPNIRFSEDPLRILRAIKLVGELKFKLAPQTAKAIKSKRKLLKNCSKELIGLELKAIFESEYSKKAFETFMFLNLHRQFDTLRKGLKKEYIKFHHLSYEDFLVMAFLLNKSIDEEYMSIEKSDYVRNVYKIANVNPKGNYTNMQVFTYGLDVCLAANKINNIIGKARNKEKKTKIIYDSLPIKSFAEIDYSKEKIKNLVGNNNIDIDGVMNQLAHEIIENNLQNYSDTIERFLKVIFNNMDISLPDKKEIDYKYKENDFEDITDDLQMDRLVNATNEEDIKQNLEHQGQVIRDYTEHRIDMLERRLNEQDRIIREKDQYYAKIERENRKRKIKEDVEALISKNLDLLKEMNYLENPEQDRKELADELSKVYFSYINDAQDVYTNKEEKNEKN
ncbi:MAG: hypothetical protein WC008_01330 [Bacilli bacterium]